MIISASQPYFAPFPGFFYKAHLSDVFVILDEVQFPRGTTWITRNRFKNDQGALWMTVPVMKKGLGLQRINQVRIHSEGRWRAKHLESIKSAYGHAPYLEAHLEFVEEMFSKRYDRLIDLNVSIIDYLWLQLGIKTEMELLSELAIGSTGTTRLVEICRTLGADRFLAQAPARKYLDASLFESAGISLEFLQPPSPVYPQLWGDFIPNLSAFDLLFNCGPKARDILIRNTIL
ncbi:MAG: WbqC family protein [Desulfobacterales bacterium]|nr:WbqC family protein [Desulfobacterales bacterium]